MQHFFELTEGSSADRDAIRKRIPYLDRIDGDLAEGVVTAWVTAWKCSTHEDVDRMPYTMKAPDYSLMDHVKEVTELGVMLADYREATWSEANDPEILIPTLILHDVDKPLLYERRGNECVYSRAGVEIPHGVLGGMLLQALGFNRDVVSVVTTHAHDAPFHSRRDEAWILHYADFYSCDHALRTHGLPGVEPFYRRHA